MMLPRVIFLRTGVFCCSCSCASCACCGSSPSWTFRRGSSWFLVFIRRGLRGSLTIGAVATFSEPAATVAAAVAATVDVSDVVGGTAADCGGSACVVDLIVPSATSSLTACTGWISFSFSFSSVDDIFYFLPWQGSRQERVSSFRLFLFLFLFVLWFGRCKTKTVAHCRAPTQKKDKQMIL